MAELALALPQVAPTVYFRTPANLRKWKAALAKLRTGTARPRFLAIGTSKIAGYGAGTSGNPATVGAAAKSITKYLADYLIGRGYPTSRQSFFGGAGFTSQPAYAAFDPRVALGTNWFFSTNYTLGGGGFRLVSPNVNILSFSPDAAVPVDTIVPFYYSSSAQGEFTVSDGASVRATINAYNASVSSLASQAVTLSSLATGKTINFTRTNTDSRELQIAGAIAYDSTVPAIDLINAGWGGSLSNDWINAASPWSPLNAIGALSPNITVINIAANDLFAGVAVATFTANIQALITKGKLSGDVVIVIEAFGSQPQWGAAVLQESFRQALIGLGALNGCMVVDLDGAVGGYTVGNSLGLYSDLIHENANGYALEAAFLGAALLD